jgi:putative flippase GtrA
MTRTRRQSTTRLQWLRSGPLQRLRHEIAKFGTVGAAAYVIDVGTFNLLQIEGFSPISHKPITSKIISSVIATLFAYAGNRYWAFAHREVGSHRQSLSLFFLFNAVGMGIASSCLALTHYGLGLTSTLADNISANILGTGLGTLFRFWAYRRYIFRAVPQLVDE